ncbi:ImmA/IrrE family metallo-endopeptidase [Pseudomonas mosselii]|uniref:ImmA/IrrE family metallo-endopeptidase n=1 Tax=Pseudomonas TaxID=286 RepID=UPI000CF448EF|nr:MULTISPECIES: ImmA/IrrE family metallo-endopeptidase [Pseudomonas]MDH1657462.1 ImmA/IrrE family metallo-endopeptidase [Pseudomonas mosselii]MDH1717918.1 ImmA/IrrE family metallo-endopeptidase [Pseudomonas mosselii]MDH1720489.1 ImmA/IrrE family metallo-endopeptidase [Pseudomonas mosselii]
MAFIRKSVKPKIPERFEQGQAVSGDGRFSVAQVLDIAKQGGVQTSPLDVKALLGVLGISLISIPMEDDISGMLSLSDNGKDWVVKVNALHHPNRQRFTIAHEIAHFCRHRFLQAKFEDLNFFRNGESNQMEVEANRFASELLMPESIFRDKVRALSGSIEDIASFFKVSTLAVRVRAKNLGMKGHGLD